MSHSSRFAARTLALLLCVSGSAPVAAESSILSGMFDGAEPTTRELPGYGCAETPLGYRQSTFRVSISGIYKVYDAFDHIGRHGAVTVFHQVHERSFNPAAPGQNLKQHAGTDAYSFTAGVAYVLVVQAVCRNVEGAWAISFTGPGTVSSDSAAAVPHFTKGRFTANDPTKPFSPYSDALAPYRQSGPIRVSRDGTYYFSDTFISAQVSLQIYSAPVNPDDPWANLVASAAYGAPLLELRAGRDYYFVTQWIYGQRTGEFLYVLAPPAPFRVNPGLAGSWYNPATPGQGFFLTVFEDINRVFLAWFTYASEAPADDAYGHRWMTALGNFEGPSAELAIEWTAGGAFDAAEPAPAQHTDGILQLDFSDCSSGQISYGWGFDEFDSPTVSGVIPIRRLANDSVALCESLYGGPGMPGPL